MRTKARQRKQAASGVTVAALKTARPPLRGDGRESKVLKSEKLSPGIAKIRKREGLRRVSEGLRNSEERIIHLNSALRAIRNVNQLIVHEKNRERLIRKSCRLLVEARSYTNAWILLVDKDQNFVSAASAGTEEKLSFLMEELKQGKYPPCVHKVLGQEQPLAVYDDVSRQCKGCGLAGSHSRRSAFMGRLEYEGKVYGIIAVHILPELASNLEEQSLFRELAGDIAYALASIDREEERERLHKELRSSDERYRDLFESTSDLIQSMAPDGRLLYTNKAWRDVLGYSEEEIAHLKIWDIISPESMDHCMGLFKRVIAGEHVSDIEAVFVAKDGSLIAVEGDAHCRFAKGKPVSTQGFFRDVTKRKRADEALQASTQQWQTTFDAINDAVFLLDSKGMILRCNNAATALVGKPFEKIVGGSYWEVVQGSPEPMEGCPLMCMLKSHCRETLTFPIGDRWYQATADPVLDKSGNLLGAIYVIVDITEGKKAEEALWQSEVRYRTVLEEMDEGYFEVDVHGNFTVINDATCRVLGYPREKIIGTNYQAFVTEEYVDAVYKVFNQVYQTGTPIRQFTWEVLREDGGRRFIEALLSPLQDQEGRLIGFQGVGRDITERKRADDELRQSEERYRTLFNSKLDGICVMDETMKVLLVNQAAVDIFGFDSIDEALGANPFDFIPPEERERVLAIVKKDMFEDDLRQANEFRLTNKSGKDIWVSAIGTLTEYQGKLAGLISFRDITEHKRVEEALANEATRRRILIEQSRDGIVVLDENGKVYEANQRFAEMLGYSPEEVRELHVWDWEFQYPREQVQEMIRSIDEKGDHFETRHRRKDGTTYDVEISTNGAMFAGQKLVFCVCRDITERKKAEEALRRSEQNFRDSIESSPLGIRVIDKGGKTLYINRAFLNIWGYNSIEELQAVPRKQRYTPQGYAEHMEIIKKRKQGEDVPLNYEVSIVRSDGQVRHLAVSYGELPWNGERQFQVVYQDISERKQAEEKVKKLYSLQTAIRYINEALLKVDDEPALFEQVCHFLTDVEFIKFCWIGRVDKESLEVKPVAYSGFEDGYLSSLKISLSGSGYSRGPIVTAIKTSQPCTVADIENDPGFPPWRKAALKRGYASSLAVPLIHDTEVIGVLSVYSGVKGAFGGVEIDFLAEAAADVALGIRTLRLRRELQQSLASLGKALEGTVNALASVAEVRDPYTAGHQQRVTRLAVAIATEMGLLQEQIEGIHVAGTLHDVGKLYVPAEILSKPGKLSELEFSLVKLHAQAGYDILKTVEFSWPIAQIVLQHHERLDGSGYPQGLSGEDILLEAKILAVADVVEAMASHRPYRPALGMGQALDEISNKSGILYDSEVVDACFKLFYEKEFKLD